MFVLKVFPTTYDSERGIVSSTLLWYCSIGEQRILLRFWGLEGEKTIMKKALLLLLLFMSAAVYAQKTESGIWYVEGYDEQKARDYLSDNYLLDKVEGIWQSTDGFKYAIVKDVENGKLLPDKFRAIVLDSSHDGWKQGYIKGFITPGSVESVYSFKYYTRARNESNTESQNVLLVVESPVIMSFSRMDGGKVMLYKIYPQSGGSSQGSVAIGGEEKRWTGSGVVIGDKYIATNNHVVEGATTLVVSGVHGDMNTSYKVQVVVTDKNNDLAVVKVVDNRFDGFGQVPYGFRTSTVEVGTEVLVLGYPMTQIMGNEVKVTNGIISAKTGYQGDVSTYQMSAPIQPGSSGGPVFDNKGNLIGLSVSGIKSDVAQNVNYAVKLSYLQSLIESSNETIELSSTNILSSFSLPDKVKAISPFVLFIQANVENGEDFSIHDTPPVSDNIRQEAERLKQRAVVEYQNEDYNKAYVDICESVRMAPNSESHYLRGYLALNYKNEYAIAKESFLYCIEDNYRLDACRLSLGDCYLMLKEYDKAIEQYESAISLDRRNIKAIYCKALCKAKKGQHLEAIQDYKQALKYEDLVEGDYSTIYNNIAWEYRLLNRYNEAKSYIDKSLAMNHMKDYIWETNGEIAYYLGDYKACLYSMNNAITIYEEGDHGLIDAYYYRGLAKKQLGNSSGAYSDFEKAKERGVRINDSIMINRIDSVKQSMSEDNLVSSMLPYQERVLKNPVVAKSNSIRRHITAIEQTEVFTAIYFNSVFVENSIGQNTYIVDDKGEKHYLLKTENCAIASQQKAIREDERGIKKSVLYFPAVASSCKSIDLIEEQKDGEWCFYGIQFKSGAAKDFQINEDNVTVSTDLSVAADWQYLTTVTKRGSAKGSIGYNQALAAIKKEAVKKNCCLVVITDVENHSSGTRVTAKLYKCY